MHWTQGSRSSNPGLKLANAFGVFQLNYYTTPSAYFKLNHYTTPSTYFKLNHYSCEITLANIRR